MHNDIDDYDDNFAEHNDVNDNDDNSAKHGGHTAVNRSMHATKIYSKQTVYLLYWTPTMLWAIDTCHNKISADHYHMIMSLAQA